jgi:hypothetical protein
VPEFQARYPGEIHYFPLKIHFDVPKTHFYPGTIYYIPLKIHFDVPKILLSCINYAAIRGFKTDPYGFEGTIIEGLTDPRSCVILPS